jgi:hypothetical protein
MENSYQQVEVECISGHKADERPVAFVFEGRRSEIREIIDRWYEGGLDPTRPIVNYLKIRTTEDRVFLLRYLSLLDTWSAMPQKTTDDADRPA